MINFPGRAALLTALAAALSFVAAAPVAAQTSRIATGFGTDVGQNQESKVFAFGAHEHMNGDVHGSCLVIEPSSNGLVHMQVTSTATIGDTLFLAGPITTAVNAPPSYVVGGTAFFAVHDNGGWGSPPDEFAGLNTVPPFLGSLTAEEIAAFLGVPPPSAFAPLLFVNIRIF